MSLNDGVQEGMDVPVMVIPAEQYAAGYHEARWTVKTEPPSVTHKRFRMVWRRADGDYVVVDPAWEFAKHHEARLRR
jgi:hypothetical protein